MTDRPERVEATPPDALPEGPRLVADAKQRLASHDYAEAIELLESLPEQYRSFEAMDLLEQARALEAEADRLFAQVRQAVRDQQYACRAGTTTAWYATDDETALQEQAWFALNAEGTTHPVGQKAANAWGLHDMHGNVLEWCQDRFTADYYGQSPKEDPPGPPQGTFRVLRGGSYQYWSGFCRSAFHYAIGPVDHNPDLGFRVAMSIPFAGSGATDPRPSDARESPAPAASPDRPMPKSSETAASTSVAPAATASQPSAPAPPPAVAPFDATKAKEHQAAWAKHLGVPVELENWNGMRSVLIPPGEFDMGWTEAELAKLVEEAKAKNLPTTWYIDRLPVAAPKHRVKITKPFYLGRCEVTQGEYQRLEYGNNPSHFPDDPHRPMESVSWEQASAFCRMLGQRPQERAVQAEYRLPTEAEWEYACRAGATTAWYCGDDQGTLKEHAWFRANAEGTTHPVGQQAPNAWGLYDMHGNVWEWCQDWFAADYYRQSPAADPTGAPYGSFRVQRGGSWFDLAEYGRGAYRSWYAANGRSSYLGFRVARSVSLQDRRSAEPAPSRRESPPNVPQPSEPPASQPTAPAATASQPSGPAPPLAIAPFDATKAKEHQAAWAKHRGVPVEITNSIGMKLVLIPPGEFNMGSTPEDVARFLEEGQRQHAEWYLARVPAEAPQHRVEMAKPFYLGVCEVKQAEYVRVINKDPSKFKGDPNRPVDTVSWSDAVEFCQRLSASPKEKATGAVYRLPTESEWEFACRAGTLTRYSFGDAPTGLEQHPWCKDNSQGQAQPVGQMRPNAWGLFDMHGNMWEWCNDGYEPYQAGPVKDPGGTGTAVERVLRGGSWGSDSWDCRSALRHRHSPRLLDASHGFRVVLVRSDTN